MSATKRCLLVFAIIHLLLHTLVVSFLAGIAVWLRAPEAPTQADLIVVLAVSVARAFYAANMYRQCFACEVRRQYSGATAQGCPT